MAESETLTKNQALVLERLEAANSPLSAYELLDQLREEGIKAPLQIYRALEKLQAADLVHRLESLNSFVACAEPHCHAHEGWWRSRFVRIAAMSQSLLTRLYSLAWPNGPNSAILSLPKLVLKYVVFAPSAPKQCCAIYPTLFDNLKRIRDNFLIFHGAFCRYTGICIVALA